MRGLLACALLAASLAACDGPIAVRGVVRVAPGPCPLPPGPDAVYATRGPIAGAEIHLTCPGGGEVLLARSDEQGRVDRTTDGVLRPECSLVVKKEGYRPVALTLGETCINGFLDDCHLAGFFAELRPLVEAQAVIAAAPPASAPPPVAAPPPTSSPATAPGPTTPP